MGATVSRNRSGRRWQMDKTKKPPRKFSDCFAKYKHYDVKASGFGSVRDWGRAFDDVMGEDEATATLGEDDPLFILGLTALPDTLEALKKAYRSIVRIYHPDNGSQPDAAKATKIIAAYSTLKAQIERLHKNKV